MESKPVIQILLGSRRFASFSALISLTSYYSNECYGSTCWHILTTVMDDRTMGRSG